MDHKFYKNSKEIEEDWKRVVNIPPHKEIELLGPAVHIVATFSGSQKVGYGFLIHGFFSTFDEAAYAVENYGDCIAEYWSWYAVIETVTMNTFGGRRDDLQYWYAWDATTGGFTPIEKPPKFDYFNMEL